MSVPVLLQKLLLQRSDDTYTQLIRYVCVGGAAFVVDFGLLFLLTDILKLYYLFSAALSFLAGLVVNYLASTTWVFNRRRLRNPVVEFGIFAGIGLIGLGFNEGLMWWFTEQAQWHYLVSKLATTAAVFAWNFVARKFTLFN